MGEKLKDWWWAFTKNRPAKIAVSVVAVLLVASGSVGAWYWSQHQAISTNSNTVTNSGNVNTAKTGTVRRHIDGVAVAAEASNYLPIGLMVENLVTVRPQSGLGQANVVYETLAEGGITRFLAIYASGDPLTRVGPIRSARSYYVDLAEEYGGLYGHVGGSPQALGVLGSENYMTDFNQFSYSQFYYRDQAIEAPHNVFTTSELLGYALRDLKLDQAMGDYTPYQFKDVLVKSDRPTDVKPIAINFSNADYAVEWRYDIDHDQYLRWNGGQEHTDANTGDQLTARNIVVQWVDSSLLEPDTGRLDITTMGTGDALLFQDGVVVTGTWSKTTRGDRTEFLDSTGQPMVFNPGTTWIELVPKGNTVTYQ